MFIFIGYYLSHVDIYVHILKFKGQWGWPTVSVAGVIGMLAGVLACTVESISYYPTTAKMCGMYPYKIIYRYLLLPAHILLLFCDDV